MKKHITLASALLVSGGLMAQSAFSDDFESYNTGDYIGANSPNWTTWSGTTGGAEDAQVVSNQAASGSNSIYFSTTASTGGPQDVIMPFGGQYDLGTFSWESNFYVESGKGAYFNFQADPSPGVLWALSCYMVDNGDMIFDSDGAIMLQSTFPHNQWFNVRVDVNLNTNNWEVFVDNNSIGTFSNPVNQVASADLFPVNPAGVGGNDQSGYWMDDVGYSHTAYTLPNLNGGVTQVAVDGLLAGMTSSPGIQIRNLGTTAITSFDLTVDYNGSQFTENVTGVNIASTAFYDHSCTNTITLAAGTNDITVTISNVNGNANDDDANDDVKVITLDPVVPAAGKVVLAEEATGTWCGWCPRGTVAMEHMEDTYAGYFAGVAVHNGDPMVVTDYDAGIGPQISGYPSALVDRGADIDPSAIEQSFLQNITQAPIAVITPGALWDANTRQLDVSLTADFQQAVSGDYRMVFVLTEHGVTGSGSGWDQANYYAGGGSGVMGGYESLANPVPASQMVYDHVNRVLQPSWDGLQNSFPATVSQGEMHTINFSTTLDAGWDENEIQIIGFIVGPNGQVENAGIADISTAVANGYVTGLENEDATALAQPDAAFGLYPNPTAEVAFIDVNLEQRAEVEMRVISVTGQVVAARNYGELAGSYKLPIQTANYASGIYMVELRVGDSVEVKQLMVK